MLAVPRSQMIRIEGGRQLRGRISISGSKNASIPLLSACLLTSELVTLYNVPQLADTWLMGEILSALGVDVSGSGEVVEIRSTAVSGEVPPALAKRLRGSIVLLGALLARVGWVRLPLPGGDDIGARRVGEHLRALRTMGASIEELPDAIVAHAPKGLHGAQIVLDLPTVTGTENVMLAAALATGRTEIHNAAREPHVQDLARLLNTMGASVQGAGSERIVIEGVKELHGGHHRVVPDYLEAGTYALAVAAVGGEVTLVESSPQDLERVLIKLEQIGCEVETKPGMIRVARDPQQSLKSVDLVTWVHPGFPTDLQAPYLTLMTQTTGASLIQEWLYENRFRQVSELIKMGADVEVIGRDALVRGPVKLRGARVKVLDIRSGAALVIAALCADGESEVEECWHLDRGYQNLPGKLSMLGAQIAVDADADGGDCLIHT